MHPELIVDLPLEIGENPLWHHDEKRLYWIDIKTGRVFRYDPLTEHHEEFYRGEVVGGFTLQVDGSLLLFMGNGAVRNLKGGRISTVLEEIPEERGTRFNDVIADPEGRVFCGTMPAEDHPASLYRLDRDGSITKVLEGVSLSNGMGFTLDGKQLYHTDSRKRTIILYEYDRSTGEIRKARPFAAVPEGEGVPDGLTVDREGFVWSARWDGGCIVRYTPGGEEVLRVRFPVKKVSSLTFGGEDHRDMFVTTAGGDKRNGEGGSAGSLFKLRPGIQGVPEFRSRIGL